MQRQTCIALLRGINVGGHNKLPMKELAGLFAALGCRDVTTYIQSGNVLFTAEPELAARIPALAEDAIAQRFGFRIPVVTRSVEALRAVVENNPLLTPHSDPKLFHVGFLAELPDPVAVAALDPERSPPDRFTVVGREIYLDYAGGSARSKLTNAWFDRQLGTVSTMRNWRTTLKLLELAGG